MTSNTTVKIIGNLVLGFMLTLTIGCGQSQNFNSADNSHGSKPTNFEDLSSETDLNEQDLVELVGQEQILLMDEEDVRVADPTEENDGGAACEGEDCKKEGIGGLINIFGDRLGTPSCPNCSENENKEHCPVKDMFGGLPVIDIMGGIIPTPPGGGEGGGQCGDRASHIISIHGPNDTYVGVGPGNVEVSSKNALICVAKDEIIVAVGDIKNNLENAASCGEEGEEKIHICQKNESTGAYLEKCLSKDEVYIFLGRQAATDKTYLGTCLQE